MIRQVLIAFLLLSSVSLFAELSEDSLQLKVDLERISQVTFDTTMVEYTSPYTPEGALADIRNNEMKIIMPGGFGGTPTLTSADHQFQRTYHITYISQGCVRFPNEDALGYNLIIFDYLDSVYGAQWRNEVHHHAIGIYDDEIPQLNQASEQEEIEHSGTVSTGIGTFWKIFGVILITLGIGGLYLLRPRKQKE